MRKYCPQCGGEISSRAEFCTECGEKIPALPVIYCEKCGEANKPKSRFCEKCGERLKHPDTMVICPACDEVVYADDLFCMHCGKDWYSDDDDDEEEDEREEDSALAVDVSSVGSTYHFSGVKVRAKDKWTAFLLCFFLGYLGFHKFYEGRIFWGIVYLLTCGLFGIGWFIDCIILLCKPNPYFV